MRVLVAGDLEAKSPCQQRTGIAGVTSQPSCLALRVSGLSVCRLLKCANTVVAPERTLAKITGVMIWQIWHKDQSKHVNCEPVPDGCHSNCFAGNGRLFLALP